MWQHIFRNLDPLINVRSSDQIISHRFAAGWQTSGVEEPGLQSWHTGFPGFQLCIVGYKYLLLRYMDLLKTPSTGFVNQLQSVVLTRPRNHCANPTLALCASSNLENFDAYSCRLN